MSPNTLVDAGAESANGEGFFENHMKLGTALPRRAISSDASGSLISGIGGRVVLRPTPAPSRAQRTVHKVSERHFTGQICWGDDQPKRLVVESLLEYRAVLCAIYRPGFEDIREQVGPVMLQMPDGSTKDHFIDFCATYRGEGRIAMVVKPEVFSSKPEFREEVAALATVGRPVFFDDWW